MKPVLAVIGGGGCRQIECATGMLQAMDAAGIRIDRYTGSSAGAAVAALHASGMDGLALENLVRETPVANLFRPCWGHQLLSLLGVRVDHLFEVDGMYRLLLHNLTSETQQRVRVAVTRLSDYMPMMCDATPTSVLASTAIPQVFEPVKIGNELFVDGGVKNLIPTPEIDKISTYGHIYILLCNDDAPGRKPRSRIGRAAEAAFATMEREVTQIYEDGWHRLPTVTVLQPPPFASSLLEWSADHRLIAHAREYAEQRLKEGKS